MHTAASMGKINDMRNAYEWIITSAIHSTIYIYAVQCNRFVREFDSSSRIWFLSQFCGCWICVMCNSKSSKRKARGAENIQYTREIMICYEREWKMEKCISFFFLHHDRHRSGLDANAQVLNTCISSRCCCCFYLVFACFQCITMRSAWVCLRIDMSVIVCTCV